MYSKDKPGKANKGSVQVKSSNSRLQLVFSFGGKRHYLSTGYPDTPQYRKLAQMKATEIEKDILYERFDETLAKYKPKSALSTVTPTLPQFLPQQLPWLKFGLNTWSGNALNALLAR